MVELFAQWTALAAISVVVVQQILKLNIVPVYFANKYPVATNIVLSIIASVVANGTSAVVHLQNVWQWIAYVATVSVVAALTYNNTIRNSAVIQRLSGKLVPNTTVSKRR